MNPHLDRRRVLTGTAALAASCATSLATSLATSFAPTASHAAGLDTDEGVLVLPSTARWLDAQRLELRVQAWVYEKESRPITTRMLAKVMGLDLDELDTAGRELFAARTRLFERAAQGGRHLRVRLDATTPWRDLPPSGRDGSIDARVATPYAASLVTRGGVGFEIDAGKHRALGVAHPVGDRGISLVSDIDDTIKHTQMRQHRQMLLNTFARPFVAVPGMREWYEAIAREPQVAFHYVSSGPWMMAPPLEGFLAQHAFPVGSLHLRAFSLAPQALMSKSASPKHKHAIIESLLADRPLRRFVLVGDSGEQDPEIYGALARRHPQRIAAILIRDVTGDTPDGNRMAQAFAGVPRERWSLFDDPSQLERHWS